MIICQYISQVNINFLASKFVNYITNLFPAENLYCIGGIELEDILDLLDQHSILPKEYQSLTVLELEERISEIKMVLGDKLFIPAHHYQKDEELVSKYHFYFTYSLF